MTILDELIELLVRLTSEGFISEEEAMEVISYFNQTGTLPVEWELPLPTQEAIPATLRERLTESLIWYAGRPKPPSPDVAQSRFMDDADKLAKQLATGALTLKAWHRRMIELITDLLAEMATAGAEGLVDEDALFDNAAVQVAFLSRFADQAATGRLSPAQMAARARLYAGEGRAQFYQQQGANALYGWVEDYIAVDDRNTCGPCSAAEARGPYLPASPSKPLPGRICLGRGYCRCVLLPRYDEAAYLALGGT